MSQPVQQTLSIRPAMQATAQQGSSPSPSPQPDPIYPLSIPDDKVAKAVKLYNRYRLEAGLAQRILQHGPTQGDPLLSPAAAQSITSHSSRRYTPSISASTHEGFTDISSVVSFTGDESPPSGTGTAGIGLIAYDGKKVKHRTRKPLSPMAKAKAALIRYLGSCSKCHNRRVPCPLEHHDINALEKALLSKSQLARSRSKVPIYPHLSPDISSPALATSSLVTSSGGSVGQSTSLLGLGQNEELLHTFSTTSDPQSYASDPLAGIQAQATTPIFSQGPVPLFSQGPVLFSGTVPLFGDITDSTDLLSLLDNSPGDSYQNAQTVPLGVFRQFFTCQYFDGRCGESFGTHTALEDHFETAHHPITRLEPAHRFICSGCRSMNTYQGPSCEFCRAEGRVEIWICGNVMRTPLHQRDQPDGQDYFRSELSSRAPFFSSYGALNSDSHFGPGADGLDGLNDSMNPGGYTYYPGNNVYQNPNSQSDSSTNFGPGPSGSYRSYANDSPQTIAVPCWYSKARQVYVRYRFIFLTLSLVATMVAMAMTHRWLILKARCFNPRPVHPVIGFVSMLGSFIAGYSYLSVKHLKVRRGVRRTQCRPRQCPLHELTAFPLGYKRAVPAYHMRRKGIGYNYAHIPLRPAIE